MDPPAAERVQRDAVDREAAQVERARGIRYRIPLNMTSVRALGQARGPTSIIELSRQQP